MYTFLGKPPWQDYHCWCEEGSGSSKRGQEQATDSGWIIAATTRIALDKLESGISQSIVELLDCWKICLRAPLLVLNFKTRWTRERWLRHERVSTRMQTTFKKTTASSKRSNSQVSNESQIHIVTWWFLQWSASCPLEFSFSLVATGFTDFTITSIDLFTSDSEIQRKFLFVLFGVSSKNRSNLRGQS